MARTDTLGHFLTDVADAIREKGGTSEPIQASNFDTEIENLPSGGGKYAPKFISFRGCLEINLDYEIANLDTSNMTTMNSMFYGCDNLLSLDLSEFVYTNVDDIYYMFRGCTSLTHLDLRSLDYAKVMSMSNRGNIFGTPASGVPDNCEIIVKSNTEKNWINTEYSRLTNVKTVEEYEAE